MHSCLVPLCRLSGEAVLQEADMENNSYIYYEHETLPSLSEKEKIEQWELVRENLFLMIRYSDEIIAKKEFFFTQLPMAFVGSSITGTMLLPIGVLIQLWREGHFKAECPDCGGIVYILGAGGSNLSGSHGYWGCCIECVKYINGKKKSFSEIFGPALVMKKKYRNITVKRRFNLKSEKWFERLHERRRPDEVIKKRVEGASLKELVFCLKELQKKENG